MSETSKILCLCICLGAQQALAAGPALDSNPYFKSPSELKQYLVDGSDLAGEPDRDLLVEPGPNGTWRLQFQGLSRILGPEGERYSESVAVRMDYAYSDDKIVGGTGLIAGIVFCKGIAYLDRSQPSCYSMPNISKDQLGRASVIARYFAKERVPRLLTQMRDRALVDYRAGRKADAAQDARPLIEASPWKVVPVAADNVELYNDLGFFLGQGRMYKEAISVLQEVTRAVPDRAVAFLNLGDAYVGVPDIPRAKEAYMQYRTLMQKSGNGAKVPKRIQKYLQ